MNIKTFLWISQCFFDKMHANIYDDEDDDPEVIDDLEKDYLYLQDCCKGFLLFINPNSSKKD